MWGARTFEIQLSTSSAKFKLGQAGETGSSPTTQAISPIKSSSPGYCAEGKIEDRCKLVTSKIASNEVELAALSVAVSSNALISGKVENKHVKLYLDSGAELSIVNGFCHGIKDAH